MNQKVKWALAGMLVLGAIPLVAQDGTSPREHPLDASTVTSSGATPDSSCGQSLCTILRLDGSVDDIWRSPSGQIWIVGFSTLGLVHWDGQRWLHSTEMGGFKSVWGSGDDDVWAVGENVVHWDGRRWEQLVGGLEGSYGLLWTVWGSTRGDVWAAGEFGRVVHWNGARWEERPIGAERDVRAISGSSGDNVWVGTIDNEIARWDGRSWHPQSPPPDRPVVCRVESLAVVAPDDVWLADGCDLFRWDGRRWTHVSTGFHPSRIVVAKGRILASGTEPDNVTRGAWEWRADQWKPFALKPSGDINAVVADDRGRVWIGTSQGNVMRLDP
jgi:hypothetical protein